MNKQTEALRMAIETMELLDKNLRMGMSKSIQKLQGKMTWEAIAQCKEALENLEKDPPISRKEQPADGIELEWYCKGWDDAEKDLATQEPVTHVIGLDNAGKEVVVKLQKPLYTTPPSREWVGLSNDEIDAIFPLGDDADVLDVARGIEAKLREKNG